MDLSEKDKFGLEKRSGDHLNYQASGLSAEWQFSNQSIGMAPADPSAAVCQGNHMVSSPCPSVSMVDSFCHSLWNNPTNSQSMGFCEANVQTSASSSNAVPIGKPVPMPLRLDMGGVFLPAGPGVLSPSLSHFPTDSAFIERAARFSCFNSSTFGGMVNPFGTSESLSPYSSASKGAPGTQIQMSEINRIDALNDASMPVDHGSNSENPMKDQRDKGSLVGVGVSSYESSEPEFSGGGQEERANLGSAAGDSSSKGLGAKKRKRTDQDVELDLEGAQQLSVEVTKENVDNKQRAEQNSSTMATVKPSGKQPKDSSEPPKEDYIHVRARRGQATNSHSLAERVRREKISERMKFLQDLVPGCSKVTGKAVMLDEIINYVQSLQRQVEFLSMKLAAVNPRLEFNLEGLLSKDFLQPQGGSSSTMGFSHDMIHPQLHLPQQGLIPAGMSGITHPSDALKRVINAQLTMMNGYKEPIPQMPNAWDDELHNVIQMNFGTTNPLLNTQESSVKPRDGFPI